MSVCRRGSPSRLTEGFMRFSTKSFAKLLEIRVQKIRSREAFILKGLRCGEDTEELARIRGEFYAYTFAFAVCKQNAARADVIMVLTSNSTIIGGGLTTDTGWAQVDGKGTGANYRYGEWSTYLLIIQELEWTTTK